MNEKHDTKWDGLLGKTLAEAEKLTEFKIRPVRKNNQPFILTCDYRIDRLNVELDQDSKISKVLHLG